MNWDYPIHSFTDPNVEPQTPTRTPTTSSFETSFQTPKLESSFYDPRVTWNTADPYGSSPELIKFPPRFDLASPSPQRGRLSGGDGLNSGGTTLGSGRKTRALNTISSSRPDMSDGIDATSRSAASMQTPPPTSTSRRRMQDPMNLTTDDAATPVQETNTSQLETPSRFIGLSPNFYGFQGTPDLFRVAGASVTESSYIPRYQMPWYQENAPQSSTMMDPAMYSNHFDISSQPQPQPPVEAFDADPTSEIGLETPRLPVTQSVGRKRVGLGIPQDLRYLDTQQGAAISSSFSASPRMPAPQNDDPSMFLSSPARRFGFSDPSYSPSATRIENRQPYHYQMEESERDRRERGLCKVPRTRSVGQKRHATAAATSATATYQDPYASLPRSNLGRPPARRTTTHSGAISRQNSFSAGTMNSMPGSGVTKTPSKGRTSPFKTQMHSFPRPTSLAAPMEALVLKVGKDGIATTEMKMAPCSQSQFPDASPDISIEELSTESDSDLSDTSERRITRSQNPSFNFPDITPRRPRIARTPSSSCPHSKSSSRSSTVGSSHSGYNPGWTDTSRGRGRQLDVLSAQDAWDQRRRHSVNPSSSHSRNYSITDSEATQEDDEADDAGHAQHALKQVLKARKRQSVAGYGSMSRASHSLAMATLRSSPPLVGYPESYAEDVNSPTKMTETDTAPTQTMDRQNNPSTGTRLNRARTGSIRSVLDLTAKACHRYTSASTACTTPYADESATRGSVEVTSPLRLPINRMASSNA
ncbi:PHD finger domain-containing protein [Arthroderma uncinatum]|uniref:PHD finger domain-containing protein n=1 Tax=Arthroderma uncinatum TaxID=74035 RepID=UPI00144A6FE3|nr:PHD finger domain-containing protein [Arthroderma uncinatum]KAF3481066.1 PHD finger domain-containing protein [Arthroderma uncinatum]